MINFKEFQMGKNVIIFVFSKVDMNKVKLETIKPWIGKRITELLGMEDDVVEEFVNNQLEADTVLR